MIKFFDACIYTTSSGLLSDFLDSDQAQGFTKLTGIYEGLYGYATYKSTYYDTSLTTPTTMSSYYSTQATYADFSADDYDSLSSDTHKYSSVLTSLNTLTSCANDKWVLYTGSTNCSGYTIWTSTDGETGGNTSSNSMCIR